MLRPAVVGGSRSVPPAPAPAGRRACRCPRDGVAYRLKRKLLGPPLHSERARPPAPRQAHRPGGVRLGQPELAAPTPPRRSSTPSVPAVGLLAFSLVMPITGALLVMLALLILRYRETIKAYPSAGGAYLVTRDNFGIVPAQVAGAALLVGYILTVAVSVSAGTAALISSVRGAEPVPGADLARVHRHRRCSATCAGVKESGKVFAVPTYFFMLNMGVLLVLRRREVRRRRPHRHHAATPRASSRVRRRRERSRRPLLRRHRLRARQGVRLGRRGGHRRRGDLQRRPRVPRAGVEATPARRSWSWACGLGVMFLGLSAPGQQGQGAAVRGGHPHRAGPGRRGGVRHRAGRRGAQPTRSRPPPCSSSCWPPTPASPTSRAWPASRPATASSPASSPSAATDWCSPTGSSPWPAAAAILVVLTNAAVTRLIPLYAIGVFVGLHAVAGGHDQAPPPPARSRAGGRASSSTASAPSISAFVRGRSCSSPGFDDAWLMLIVMPLFVVMLLRLNRQYEREAQRCSSTTCRPPPPRRSSAATWCWCSSTGSTWPRPAPSSTPARSRPTSCAPCTSRSTRTRGPELADEWARTGLQRVPLEMVDCPDRRLIRAAVECVVRELSDGETEVSVLLPDRKYQGIWHRVLHDKTADAILEQLSRLPHANVTSVPFHLDSRGRRSGCRCRPSSRAAPATTGEGRGVEQPDAGHGRGRAPTGSSSVPGCMPIAEATLALAREGRRSGPLGPGGAARTTRPRWSSSSSTAPRRSRCCSSAGARSPASASARRWPSRARWASTRPAWRSSTPATSSSAEPPSERVRARPRS